MGALNKFKGRVTFLLLAIFIFIPFVGLKSAFASDITAPILIDFKNIGTINGNDLSKSEVNVKADFIVADDSPIQMPNLLLKNSNTTQLTEFAKVSLISKSGNLTQFEATAVIKQGQAPREWKWVLYPLTDSLGNSNNQFGPDTKWANSIYVYDKDFTQEIALCESLVKSWNQKIENLNNFEQKYSNSVDVFNAINTLRLRFKLGNKLFEPTICSQSTSDFGVLPEAKYGPSRLTDFANQNIVAEAVEKYNSVTVKSAQESKIKDLTSSANELLKSFDLIQPKLRKEDLTRWLLPLKSELLALISVLNNQDVFISENQLSTINSKYQKILGLIPASSSKIGNTTITCIKGKLTKKVTGQNPKCPAGYKRK